MSENIENLLELDPVEELAEVKRKVQGQIAAQKSLITSAKYRIKSKFYINMNFKIKR